MRNKLTVALAVCLLMPALAYGQDAKVVLDGATKAMGDANRCNTPAAAPISFSARA